MLWLQYDAENVGRFGGGGEYTVQAGFGWTNGLVFELLAKYSAKGGSSGASVGGYPGWPGLGNGLGLGSVGLGQDVSNSLANSVDRVKKGVRNASNKVLHGAARAARGEDKQREDAHGPRADSSEKDTSG